MKRRNILASALILLSMCTSSLFADTSAEEQKTYEYNNLVFSLDHVNKPVVTDNYIIFTAESGPRFVGIAFDFENYSTVHSFQIRKSRDLDNKITRSILFYILERPKQIQEISYRLIIDGLWTSDPNNPQKQYDPSSGITLSKIYLQDTQQVCTDVKKDSCVTFVYNGEPGQSVRLAGNFTNWDSWIYELNETKPGFYEISIPLPTGTYYYNYYLGMNSLVDKTNPNRAYTSEGKVASVIHVD